MHWFAQAPSNIALIKYMGKLDEEKNIPLNDSLSYTLNELYTSVTIEVTAGTRDIWEPLQMPGYKPFELSTQAQHRYLQHLATLKTIFNYSGAFIVRSCNNFPQATGLASSASSFAALTKCAVIALSELTQVPILAIEEQAKLARMGSGSACRSFFSPWALWSGETVRGIELPYSSLLHQAIIINNSAKEVSSSQAHLLIRTSPLYETRLAEATNHLKLLLQALSIKDWKSAYEICWKEFQNMHALFTTCSTPFTYITPRTHEVLDLLQNHWKRHNDGPIVTMDAGPNIHLLYRPDQEQSMRQFTREYLVGNYDVI